MGSISGRVLGVLLATTLPLLQGCYVYHSGDPADLAVGQRVRARVTPAESRRLAALTTEGSPTLSGQVVEIGRDSVLMSVLVHSELQGNRIRNLEQRIYVDRGAIVAVDTRSLDRGRTALVAATALIGVGSIAALKARNSGTLPGGGDPPPETLVPLFRFYFPWF